MTPADLARAYNALREKCERHKRVPHGDAYCEECVWLRDRLAALPPLPVADVPVGRWICVGDGQEYEVREREQHPQVIVEDTEGGWEVMDVHDFLRDFRPAPEAGE